MLDAARPLGVRRKSVAAWPVNAARLVGPAPQPFDTSRDGRNSGLIFVRQGRPRPGTDFATFSPSVVF